MRAWPAELSTVVDRETRRGWNLTDASEADYWGVRVLRGFANAFVISFAVWGVVALGAFLWLRPVAITDMHVISVAPPGGVMFCMLHVAECRKARPARLSVASFAALDALNYAVNSAIAYAPPERTEEHGLNDWEVLRDGEAGPCIASVLTKRHRLIAAGYPSGAFGIGIVRVAGITDELHAVLLAHLDDQVYVLDSRSNDVQPVERVAGYEWISHSAFGNLLAWTPGAPTVARLAPKTALSRQRQRREPDNWSGGRAGPQRMRRVASR